MKNYGTTLINSDSKLPSPELFRSDELVQQRPLTRMMGCHQLPTHIHAPKHVGSEKLVEKRHNEFSLVKKAVGTSGKILTTTFQNRIALQSQRQCMAWMVLPPAWPGGLSPLPSCTSSCGMQTSSAGLSSRTAGQWSFYKIQTSRKGDKRSEAAQLINS